MSLAENEVARIEQLFRMGVSGPTTPGGTLVSIPEEVTGTISSGMHGDLPGGTLHDEATPLIAGFLPAFDKAKLDNMSTDEIDALGGTNGTPSAVNPYVTNSDPRLSAQLVNGNLIIPLRNQTGSSLARGLSVVITGYDVATGRLLVSLADKDNEALRPANAVTASDIPDNTNFDGVIAGHVTGLNTAAFALTDQLILGSAGVLIRPPDATNSLGFTGELQNIGSVVRVDATSGEIQVQMEGLTPGFLPFPDDVETFDVPEAPLASGSSIFSLTSTLVGASFVSRRAQIFNRMVMFVSTLTLTPTITVQVFQVPGGKGGSGAKRLATAQAVPITSTGSVVISFQEGNILLDPGHYYVLCGLDSVSGSVTLKTFNSQTTDLLNDNVDPDTHATGFTTSIAATTTPATFDPRPTPTGQANPTSSDVAPIQRVKRV